MGKKVTLEALDAKNWLTICDLSVSDAQKKYFEIPNVYWIGKSRYEEGDSKLFAIKFDDEYVGLIGGGYDEDGVTGWICPVMVDHRYQKNGYGKAALYLMIEYLEKNLGVDKININNCKFDTVVSKLYEEIGFFIYEETADGHYRQLDLSKKVNTL